MIKKLLAYVPHLELNQCGLVSVLAPLWHDRGQIIFHWLLGLFRQNDSAVIGGGKSHMFTTSQSHDSARTLTLNSKVATLKLLNTRRLAQIVDLQGEFLA